MKKEQKPKTEETAFLLDFFKDFTCYQRYENSQYVVNIRFASNERSNYQILQEVSELLSQKGYFEPKYKTPEYKTRHFYLSSSSLDFNIIIFPENFSDFEELKIFSTYVKEYLDSLKYERVYFEEEFLDFCKRKDYHDVVNLYNTIKHAEIDSPIEQRYVFNQLDQYGKFIKAMRGDYGNSYCHELNINVKIENEKDIVVDKVHFCRVERNSFSSTYEKNEYEMIFETEIIEVFDGLFTSVFTMKSSEDIMNYFNDNEHIPSFDVVKTKDGEVRLQGFYLPAVRYYLPGQAAITTDTTFTSKEQVNSSIKLGLSKKPTTF